MMIGTRSHLIKMDSIKRKTTDYEKVKSFNLQMEMETSTPLIKDNTNLLWFRFQLIKEEFEELQDAIWNLNNAFLKGNEDSQTDAKAHLLKELCDLLYVAHGLGVSFGLDIDEAFNRVHESNMSKLVEGKPLKNKDGKVLKGYNYKKPFLNDLV